MTATQTRRLTRDRFRQLFRERWGVGEHVSLIGPTGKGKSYTARQILTDRPGRSLILAPKGADKTMAGFGHKITRWPPPYLTTPRPKAGQHWVLRLEPPLKKLEDSERMRGEFGKAIAAVFRMGRWTLYVDELQVTADPRMMGQGKAVEQLLVMGRSRGISVVSSIQAPRWAPRAAYDQASHVLMWRQRDKQALKRIDEIGGIDPGEIEAVVRTLNGHEFVWIDAARDQYYTVSAN